MFRTGPELEQKGQNRPIYGHIGDNSRTVGSPLHAPSSDD
jgi:hypothetical protein